MESRAAQPDNVIELGTAAAQPNAAPDARTCWFDLPGREIDAAGLGAVPRLDGGDLRGVRDGSRDAGHPRHARPVPARPLRGDGRVRRRAEALDDASRPSTARRSRPRPGQIIEGPIEFHCLCEHHALPFFGTAHIGYIAGERIIGISKLTRLVRLFARRFTVQERLGEQIADGLVSLVAPRGVAVHLEASHLCTQMRGRRGALAHGDDVLARRVRGPRAAARVPRRSARPPSRVEPWRSRSSAAVAARSARRSSRRCSSAATASSRSTAIRTTAPPWTGFRTRRST